MYSKTALRLSRRALLGGAGAGIGLLSGAIGLRAEKPEGPEPRAIAFDSAALILANTGLWRSEDGEASWVALAGVGKAAVTALATHPDRPGRIHAGLKAGGLILSEDGGRTWSAHGAGLPAGPVTSMTVAAAAPDTLFVSILGDGIWRSQDAGATWEFVMDRPYLGGAEREVLTLSSVDLATGMGGIWIYAGTETGLTRVPDCFCRWQDVQPGDAMDALASGAVPAPEAPLPAGEAVFALVSVPQAPGTLYAALTSGIWNSTDGGVAWVLVADADARALAVNPADPNHVVAATRGGVSFSRDGGATWSAIAAIG